MLCFVVPDTSKGVGVFGPFWNTSLMYLIYVMSLKREITRKNQSVLWLSHDKNIGRPEKEQLTATYLSCIMT